MMERPNIILFMTDQQQARASAREGFPLDTTPTLDRLGQNGCWFDKAYTSAPICLPARVSTLSGLFPSATGAVTNKHAKSANVKNDIPGLLNEAGYTTALIGKNHSHLTEEHFDHAFVLGHGGGAAQNEEEEACDQWLKALHHMVANEPAPFSVESTPPARVVQEACRWIDNIDRENSPFFIWLSVPEPHNPYYAPEPYFSMFDPKSLPPVLAGREAGATKGAAFCYLQEQERVAAPELDELMPRYRANYYGMLRLIDDQISRLMNHLEKRKLLETTVFIGVSDHGDYVGDYGLMRKGAGTCESLMRIPFVVSGAGISTQGRHSAHVSLVDILPTVCEMSGIGLPPEVQGRSLCPLLKGEHFSQEEFASILAEQGFGGVPWDEKDSPDPGAWAHKNPAITFNELGPYTQSGTARMLRRGDWKLVLSSTGQGELYNLKEDPAEVYNRFNDNDPNCVTKRCELALDMAQRFTQFQPVNPDPGEGMRIKVPPHNWKR